MLGNTSFPTGEESSIRNQEEKNSLHTSTNESFSEDSEQEGGRRSRTGLTLKINSQISDNDSLDDQEERKDRYNEQK